MFDLGQQRYFCLRRRFPNQKMTRYANTLRGAWAPGSPLAMPMRRLANHERKEIPNIRGQVRDKTEIKKSPNDAYEKLVQWKSLTNDFH